MGLGGMSPWSLVLILVIVLLLFGTKKLRNLGSDLGGAMKGFKKAMTDEEAAKEAHDEDQKKVEAENLAAETSKATQKESAESK